MVTAAMVMRLDMSISTIVQAVHSSAPLRLRLQREWLLMVLLLILHHIVLLIVHVLCDGCILYS